MKITKAVQYKEIHFEYDNQNEKISSTERTRIVDYLRENYSKNEPRMIRCGPHPVNAGKGLYVARVIVESVGIDWSSVK